MVDTTNVSRAVVSIAIGNVVVFGTGQPASSTRAYPTAPPCGMAIVSIAIVGWRLSHSSALRPMAVRGMRPVSM